MSATDPLTSLPFGVIAASVTPNLTLGPLVIGAFVLGALYGITSVQAYIYYNYNHRPTDKRSVKWMVLLLWILDTIQVILCAHVAWHYLVTWVDNPAVLEKLVWTAAAQLIVGSVSDGIVISALVYRIWQLHGKKWPLLVIGPPAIISFITFEVMGILTFIITDITESQEKEKWVWILAYATQVFADVVIALFLCMLLIKRRTSFRRTNSLINSLIMYSVNTCILTSSVAVAALVTYVLLPRSFYWVLLAAILPKLMMNCLLAMINSRYSLRSKASSDLPMSIHLSRLGTDVTTDPNAPHGIADKEIDGVEVHVKSEVARDFR